MERRFSSQRCRSVDWSQRSLFRRLPRHAAGIYFCGKIRFSLSGAGALMAKSVAWNAHLRNFPGGFRLLPRKSRSNREHRIRAAVTLSNFTRALPRHDCLSAARAVDATAVSGTGVRRVEPVPILRGYRRRFRTRRNSERSCRMAGAIFIASRGPSVASFARSRRTGGFRILQTEFF